MKRRQRPINSLPPVQQNLDSFLDILTNTVGILMFIGVFVSLVAVEASTMVQTPLVKESRKTPYLIELRENSFIDLENYFPIVQDELETFINSLPTCVEPSRPYSSSLYALRAYIDRLEDYNRCTERLARRASNFEVTTEHYRVSFDFIGESRIYESRNNQTGENVEELEQENSEFQKLLSELNPEEDYLAFIVRPESFPIFRKAREMAWKEGFDVGWEPHPSEEPIVLGSNGRNINVQ